eukprot:3913704-Prymnesium_polylepis.2
MRTHSNSPFCAAARSGVSPWLSATSGSARASMRSCTHSTCPSMHAACRHVAPSSSSRPTVAPISSNMRTQSTCPCEHAMVRGGREVPSCCRATLIVRCESSRPVSALSNTRTLSACPF